MSTPIDYGKLLRNLDAAIAKASADVREADEASGEYGEGGGAAMEAYYEAVGFRAGLQHARFILTGSELLLNADGTVVGA